MKKRNACIITLVFMLSLFTSVVNATAVFSEDFSGNQNLHNTSPDIGGNWDVTSGTLTKSGELNTKNASTAMKLAFAALDDSLGVNEQLRIVFTADGTPADFATTGWVGLSLYSGGKSGEEHFFLGSPGLTQGWGIDGSEVPRTPTNPLITSPSYTVEFVYDYNSGDWAFTVGANSLSGTASAGIKLNTLRIGADINNNASMIVKDIQVYIEPANSSEGTVFADDFSVQGNLDGMSPDVGGDWNVTSGSLTVENGPQYLNTKNSNTAMKLAYAHFNDTLGANQTLHLVFKTSGSPLDFATSGWVGLSLYSGGSTGEEHFFFGSPGNISGWGVDGTEVSPAIASDPLFTHPHQTAEFVYEYNSGKWEFTVGNFSISDVADSMIPFDALRIGADSQNRASLIFYDIEVSFDSLTTLPSRSPALGLYSSLLSIQRSNSEDYHFARNGVYHTTPGIWATHYQGITWEGDYVYLSTSDNIGSLAIFQKNSNNIYECIAKKGFSTSYAHGCGITSLGDVLVSPYEGDDDNSQIRFFNVKDSPEDPQLLNYCIKRPDDVESALYPDKSKEMGKASSVAVTEVGGVGSKKYVMAVYEYDKFAIAFYVSNNRSVITTDETKENGKVFEVPQFTYHSTVVKDSISDGNLNNYQGMSMFTDTTGGTEKVYLLGFYTNNMKTFPSDHLDIMEVTGLQYLDSSQTIGLTKDTSLDYTSQHGGYNGVHFGYGGAAKIDPSTGQVDVWAISPDFDLDSDSVRYEIWDKH